MNTNQPANVPSLDDQEARQRRAEKAYEEWSRRASARMPQLAARVFALRDKGYPGCGYHYAMEAALGKLIARICDPTSIDYHDPKKPVWVQHMASRIHLRALIRDIWRAEHNGGKRYARERARNA
jgi:hypothetical protein